jgi:hypothetical protein
MRRNLYFLCLLVALPIMAFGVHKHYISLTKVDYIKEKEVVQVTMKFFIDDIELALENRNGQAMELTTKDEHKMVDEFLESYIRQKFKIWINEEEKEYAYLGKEYENNEVFFYLEIENISDIETIEVQNAMLFEEFEEQQNYIKLNVKNVRKTFILIKANDREILKL